MRTRALHDFCSWLEQTPMSQTIQTVPWIVPTVQTIHILAIAAVMSSVLMLSLRLIGVVGRDQLVRPYSARYLPVIWWSLPVLLASGAIMIVGEPVRSLESPVFQLKVLLIIAAFGLTFIYQAALTRNAAYWTDAPGRRVMSVVLAFVALALWIGIVFAGRWIAYY
jgi:hypothetical protein